ncbi:MAG: CopG family transcriptional regulator [Epsilonproteobacteria bacterium]|nr:CopG family transcriptional regulator [Campylobacterota bacterium]
MKELYIEDSLFAELIAYSNELKKTKDEIIKEALISYFDKADEILSDKMIDEIKKGNEKLFTLDEVKKELNV